VYYRLSHNTLYYIFYSHISVLPVELNKATKFRWSLLSIMVLLRERLCHIQIWFCRLALFFYRMWRHFLLDDSGTQKVPGVAECSLRVRKWSQDRKWSRTANDPQIEPQMIPDRKWSPYWTANDPDQKIRNGMDLYQRKVRTCTKMMN